MYKYSHIPLRNPNTIKYIYGTISRKFSRVSVKRPALAGVFKKIRGHPDIFRPQHDCGWCGGGGCGHCS